MIYNNVLAREVAEYLLEIKAVVLNPTEPFTWASGLKSPIYCDNRKALSYPAIRDAIKIGFEEVVTNNFPTVKTFAGVATAGIPWGAILAYTSDQSFIYVRDKPKVHGLENVIEGVLLPNQNVVVIEDLISTGKSSLNAVKAVREKGGDVIGLVAIFTYNFTKADTAFTEANCPYFTLTNYPTLVEIAIEKGYVKPSQREALVEWYENPEAWSVARGEI